MTVEARGVYVLLNTTTGTDLESKYPHNCVLYVPDKYYDAEEENEAILNLKRKRLDDVCFQNEKGTGVWLLRN